MLMKLGFLSVSLFFSILIQAQNLYQKVIGGVSDDKTYGALQTRDKGFILGGYSYSQAMGGCDMYLVKTDSTGKVQWGETFGGPKDDEGYAVRQTADDGFIFCGYTKSFGSGGYDVYLIRTKPNGDTLWTKTYGGALDEFGNAIQITADGGYIIGGYTSSFSYNKDSGNAYMLKLDPNGNLQWSKTFSGPSQITDVYDIVQTPDHGYAMTGYSNAFGEPNGDAFLAKTDSMGNLQFIKTYGFKGYDWGTSLIQTADGGFMIGGTYSTDSTSLDLDVYLLKTNPTGDTTFTRTYGGKGSEFGQCIRQVTGGNYILGGYTNSFGAGAYDACVMKFNNSGDTLFSRLYGGPLDDEANCVMQCTDGSIALAGLVNSFGAGAADVYLVKMEPGDTDCNTNSFPALRRHSSSKVGTYIATATSTATLTTNTKTIVHTVIQGSVICNTTGIAPITSSDPSLFLFPNPGKGVFRVRFENPEAGDYSIGIHDILGKNLLSIACKSNSKQEEQDIDLSAFSSGVYFVEVKGENFRHAVKMVLEKE